MRIFPIRSRVSKAMHRTSNSASSASPAGIAKSTRSARYSVGSQPLATLANVGKATLGDLALLGIRTRAQLARRDAYRLYERLCALTGRRHDPCVIDVFLAAISECRGNPPRDWWRFTAGRKRALAQDPMLAPSATPASPRAAGASRAGPSRAGRGARRSRSRDARRQGAR